MFPRKNQFQRIALQACSLILPQKSSETKMSNSDSDVLPVISTEPASIYTLPTIRETLLSCIPDYNLTEELINKLTDDQLENSKKYVISLHKPRH